MTLGLALTISILLNVILFVLYSFDKAEQYIYSTNKKKQCMEYKEHRDMYFDELRELQIKYDTLKFTYDELIKLNGDNDD
jgi:hypothetical protein